jgi:hypothetical protein
VNKFSVNVFITTINRSVAEASTCTINYFNEASVLYMVLTLDLDMFLLVLRHVITELWLIQG